MNFITEFPKNLIQHDSIMVLVNKISKVTHFIPVKYTYKDVNIIDILMKEILRFHYVPKVIASDRDTKFTCNF